MSASPPLTPAQLAAQEPCLAVLRELVRTYQAFSAFDEVHIRQLGLTCPQFDVIATLGNTPGLTMGQIAEKTLVTKGTLTGIVDRLEKKGLVQRIVPPENRRCFVIVLTPAGEQVFNTAFPIHIQTLKRQFGSMSASELAAVEAAIAKIRLLFQPSATATAPGMPPSHERP
jgi:MarR family transcriptional regulator, 2-MHQ and catechol-resistance regulon repressor